jgi:hypothetical protein
MRKYVSRFPNERPGEALIDWEERELMKKAKKLGLRTKPMRKKDRRPEPSTPELPRDQDVVV